MLRLIHHGIATYHTRQLYISDKYREAYFALHYPDKDMPKATSSKTNDPTLHKCPLCTIPGWPAGTASHLHCLCKHPTLLAIRNAALDTIKDTLSQIALIQNNTPNPTNT